jgi:hypothetical protein
MMHSIYLASRPGQRSSRERVPCDQFLRSTRYRPRPRRRCHAAVGALPGQGSTYKPGEFFPESVGQWHMGANIGAEPLKLLVIDIVEKGQTNTTLQIR